MPTCPPAPGQGACRSERLADRVSRRASRRSCPPVFPPFVRNLPAIRCCQFAIPARSLPAGFLVGFPLFLRCLPAACPPVFPPFLRRLSVCCRGFPAPRSFRGSPLSPPSPGFFVRCLCCLRPGHEKGDAAKSGIPVRASPVSRVLFPGRCPGPCHLSGTAVTCRL